MNLAGRAHGRRLTPDRRVRVVQLVTRLNAGGAAHQVGILSARMTGRYETLLVHGSVGSGEAALANFDSRYPAARLEVAGLRPEINIWDDARALIGLARAFRDFRPDVVHTHTAKAGLLGRLAALPLRPRPVVVHTYHGHVLRGYFGPTKTFLYRRAERALAHISDSLVAVSHATLEDLRSLGVGRRSAFCVVPVGVDLHSLLAVAAEDGRGFRDELGVKPDETLVVAVGRLVPIKRYDVALRALAAAQARGETRLRLAIVGDGPCRGPLIALARELGLDDRVQFTGARGDIPNIASAADIALVTSDNEGTPVWLIEASAAGTPAVATLVGGVGDIVTARTGITCPAGDSSALSAALVALAGDPGQRSRLGRQARAYVEERFSAERLLRDMDVLYASHLENRASKRSGRGLP